MSIDEAMMTTCHRLLDHVEPGMIGEHARSTHQKQGHGDDTLSRANGLQVT